MEHTKQKIARNLDAQFAAMGFAAPGVDALREGADVSLRTLYKYYPSREAMVAGALLIIHEGQTCTAMVRGPEIATQSALRLARALLKSEGPL